MSEGKKVPKIRFPGFEGEWETKKISELIEIYNEKVSSDCTLPVLTSSKSDGIQFQADHFGREQGHDIEGYNVLPRGFCTYRNRSDGTDFTFNINNLCNEGIISKFYPVFNTKEGYNLLFLVLLLNNEPKTLKTIAYTAKGTGQKVLSISDLLKIDIVIPDSQEQQKIGLLFEQVNDFITYLKNELDKWKVLKKGLLQKLFPKEGESVPEIRFPGFDKSWLKRQLSDLGVASSGIAIESEFSVNGQYKVVSIGSYSEDSTYRDQGIRAVASEKTRKRILNKNDLTMILNDKTPDGNIIGRVLLIDENDKYVYNQRTQRIEVDKEKYDPVFLYEMLNAPNIREKIIMQCQGNTQIYVNWSTISQIEYLFPCKEEQIAIGSFFSLISRCILYLYNQLEKWKELKKGLLQQMFVA